MAELLLEVNDLSIQHQKAETKRTILETIRFSVEKNQIVCLVGESGSGKSVTAKAILQLLPDELLANHSGNIFFEQEDLLAKNKRQLSRMSGSEISMIFQDSASSLNPVYKIKTQFFDVIRKKKQHLTKKEMMQISLDLLTNVEIKNGDQVLEQYPFQLSGGMRQRIQIALSLVRIPKLLIADEPTTALDVIVQNQIIALLQKIKIENEMSLLFITHDLSIVYNIADWIVVMEKGKIVEQGNRDQIFHHPEKPYTKKLLNSIPRIIKAN